MSVARLHVAKARIHRYLNEQPRRVFTLLELISLLTPERASWNVPDYSPSEIIEYLLQTTKLKKEVLAFPRRKNVRYVWGQVTLPELVMSINPSAYLSHHSALHLHELTRQAPKTYYLNHEQAERPQGGQLNQASIDRAFRRHPRRSNTVSQVGEHSICLLNGKQTGNLGVIQRSFRLGEVETAPLQVTDVHRTLIDAVVRPAYCGGIGEVLAAYRSARDRTSADELAAMLSQLEYVYPYHQAIGYCLEQAGHSSADLQALRRLERAFDFYLAPHQGEFVYLKRWRLFIPSQLSRDE